MANTINYGTLDPSLAVDQEALNRQVKMAQALREQSMAPIETAGRTVGGVGYAISPMEGLAKMLQGYSANQADKANDTARTALAEKQSAAMANILGGMGGGAEGAQPDPRLNVAKSLMLIGNTEGANAIIKEIYQNPETAITSIGGQTIFSDKRTGEEKRRYDNTVTPDANLNAGVSLANNKLTNDTSLTNSRLTNDTSRANNQATVGASLSNNAATVAEAMRGHDLTHEVGMATATKPQYQAETGVFVTPPTENNPQGTITKTSAYNPAKGTPEAMAKASGKVLPILQEASAILSDATGSWMGAGADQVARAFGSSTKGAQAIAKLKVLEGNLMMSQPRMEGPQSDKDVMMYRQMAGRLGDPTVPIAEKRQALDEITKIHERYAGINQAQETPAPPGVATPGGVIRFDAQGNMVQ
jgi:hypothetical protein